MKRMMIAMMLFVTMVTPQTASAAPRCPNGGAWTPQGCSYQVDADTTCAWPMDLNGSRVAWCIRQGVQQ